MAGQTLKEHDVAVSAHEALVLAVDDIRENLEVLDAMLAQPDVRLLRASSGPEALELLLDYEVAVALIDVQMPGMDGFELAELMRGTERTRRVPIIFVTAARREDVRAFRGYAAGAVDFLFKPLEPDLLRTKVNVFIELFRQRRLLAAQVEQHRQLLRTAELMLGVVGHDLRTPLGAIKNGAELLLSTHGHDQTVTRVAKPILSSSRRMARLISQLLDFANARLGTLPIKKQSMDLSELAQASVTEFESAGQTVAISASGPERGQWDPDRMAQVLSNLLENALTHGQGEEPVKITVSGDADAVMVEISNRGEIPHEIADNLFAPFARAASTRSAGTGLGLYITDQIVRAHGGTIQASSSGGWTMFRVRLPRE